jgi:sodium/hydrogen exchanger-like protein 6/7
VTAATESVAVLALLDHRDPGGGDQTPNPLLFSLVFGESVFNDAVCIVLFETLLSFENGVRTHTGGGFGPSDIIPTIGLFAGVSLGSVALGTAVGLLCSALFRRLSLHTAPDKEFLLVLLSAFIAYCLAELLV